MYIFLLESVIQMINNKNYTSKEYGQDVAFNQLVDKSSYVGLTCGSGIILLITVFYCENAQADGNVPYWLALRSNILLDEQVVHEIGSRASIVVLRARKHNKNSQYTFHNIVAKLKRNAPHIPVLSYSLVNRKMEKGRIEVELLSSLDVVKPFVKVRSSKEGLVEFLDMSDAGIRHAVVSRLLTERVELGVDGYAVDISIRTPRYIPKKLANICKKSASYCEKYAFGMDDVFSSLRKGLGMNLYFIYNGLWNSAPGMLEDQQKLLAHTDGVTIEYFGMNPRMHGQEFEADILPYLHTMSQLPKDKSVLVYARGTWNYADYLTDYRWQRYLYASYLLGKRRKDYFKYHASFQVPAHKGRAGGLDVYADWNIELGIPRSQFTYNNGLYQRVFTGGLVVVAPYEGAGGVVHLTDTKYTLEGEKVTGIVRLLPGSGLILSNNPPKSKKPVAHKITAQVMSTWEWSGAELKRSPSGDYLKLTPVYGQSIGEHDVLLDYERSLAPYRQLDVDVQLNDGDSSLLAVAEVDDPKRKHQWVVVEFGATQGNRKKVDMGETVDFRSPPLKRNQDAWPRVYYLASHENMENLSLDGPSVLNGTGYIFRRWSHLRFIGSAEVSSISLSHPMQVDAPLLGKHAGSKAKMTQQFH